jgi:hypothetical protein
MKTYQCIKETSRYAIGDLVQFSDKDAEKMKGFFEIYDPSKKPKKADDKS